MNFDILQVLREYTIQYSEDGEKVKVVCPFHPDRNPSGFIYLESKVFKCYACNTSTRFIEYLAKKLGHTTRSLFYQLNLKLNPTPDKIISPETVDRCIQEIQQPTSKQFIEALKFRCLTDELIEFYRIGVFKDRITIPIFNSSGFCVNIRKYKPGATSSKTINQSGFGKVARLYPVEQLQYDQLVLCGGEIKAILASSILNKHGIGAVCCTQGEANLPNELLENFRGCKVWICLDIDEAGRKASENHAKKLSRVTKEVYTCLLPLDKKDYPKGDINDFIRIDGDLYNVLLESEKWEFKLEDHQILPDEDLIETKLTAAVHAKFTNKKIQFKGVVSQLDTSPFSIPEEVKVICDKSEKFCDICPVNFAQEEQLFKIPDESPELIEMIGSPKKNQKLTLMSALKIPITCRKCSFETENSYNFEEVRLSEQLDIGNRSTERSMQIAYCIGEGLDLNETYDFKGRMYPHPGTQQSCFLISSYDQATDSLSNYRCDDMEILEVFQPEEWTPAGIQEKLNDIYSDFEANVTQIYRRQSLHLAIDLAYHSPLFINFENKKEQKGWVEILIVGDSAQGKSRALDSLMEHYQLGEKVDCKTASVAGLKGGVDDISNRHFISWGVIPTHDKRLVALEELKGMHPEVFSALTEMRSRGIAQITKIRKRQTQARTRLIALSNPRSDRPLSSYNYGLEAIRELIVHPEDIRRFDACFIFERNEVDINEIPFGKIKYPVKYTSELCRELILWAWTCETAVFEDEGYVHSKASEFSSKFSDDIPIADRGSIREKLARLSASLAARTFSYHSKSKIFVRNCHVDFICSFLEKQYGKESFGYKAYSDSLFKSEKLINPESVKHRLLKKVTHPKEFIENLLLTDEINVHFIQDILAYPQDVARELLSFLIRQRALKREKNFHRKTREFTLLLKELKGQTGIENKPVYTEEF